MLELQELRIAFLKQHNSELRKRVEAFEAMQAPETVMIRGMTEEEWVAEIDRLKTEMELCIFREGELTRQICRLAEGGAHLALDHDKEMSRLRSIHDGRVEGLRAEIEKMREDTDRLNWLQVEANWEKIALLCDGGWAFVVREYEDGWDTEYSESFDTPREAIDAAREGE